MTANYIKKVLITEGDIEVLENIYKYFKDRGEQDWYEAVNLLNIIVDLKEIYE